MDRLKLLFWLSIKTKKLEGRNSTDRWRFEEGKGSEYRRETTLYVF
jgi:hypothetical protein